MKKLVPISLLLTLLLAACGGSAEPTLLPPPPTEPPTQPSRPASPSNPKSPPSASDAVLGQPFALKVGESVSFPELDLTLTFEAILEDSRCPANVTCVHAGWATALLSGSYSSEPLGEVELTLPAARPEYFDTLALDGLTLQLQTVAPYPANPGDIDPDAYTITLLLAAAE